jgi:hypothetical protein
MLNFVRGGSTGYADGVSYGAAGDRNAVATGVRLIDGDPNLLTDDRHIESVIVRESAGRVDNVHKFVRQGIDKEGLTREGVLVEHD